MSTPRISLCMIVRNEEAVLNRCLDSFQGCYDELCIVDTGSCDATPTIAKGVANTFQIDESCNGEDGLISDFSIARNLALRLATNDWILQVDADEILRRGSASELRRATVVGADQIAVQICSGLNCWYSVRLFKRSDETRYISVVHEYIASSGVTALFRDVVIENVENKVGKEAAFDRNLRLLAKQLSTNPTDGRALFYMASEMRRQRRWNEAVELYNACLQVDNYPIGKFHCLYFLAVSLFLKGDIEEALVAAINGLSYDPRFAEIHCLLGDIYSTLANNDEAIACYRKALEIGSPPDDCMLAVQHRLYNEYPKTRINTLLGKSLPIG